MSGSKNYQPQPCTCGSGLPARPQYDSGRLVHFSCAYCQAIKMAVYRPDTLEKLLDDPNFGFDLNPPKENA